MFRGTLSREDLAADSLCGDEVGLHPCATAAANLR